MKIRAFFDPEEYRFGVTAYGFHFFHLIKHNFTKKVNFLQASQNSHQNQENPLLNLINRQKNRLELLLNTSFWEFKTLFTKRVLAAGGKVDRNFRA